MDNLTHTLTGLMMSRAGLNRYCPRASLLLMLAANMPDSDLVWMASSDSALYLEHHRGITHGAAMAPVMALAPLLFVGLLNRRGFPWLKAYGLAILGVLSHLALDYTNIYGIRLGLPFSGTWFRLDTTTVIDLFLWGVLLLGVFWPLLSKLVSSEIGAQSNSGRGIAWFVLAAVLLYDGGRWVLHQRVIAMLEGRLHAGENPRRVAALPYPVNPLRWTGLVEIRNGYVVHEIDLRGDFDPTLGQVYYQAEPSPAMETARKTEAFRALLDFSAYPMWRVTQLPEPEGAVQVELNDMRFGAPGEGRFTAYCILDATGRVTRSWFQYEGKNSPIRLR